MSYFSERLKITRQEKKITQKYLADYLNIQERAYQNYEYGNREPNIDSLIKIADCLNVSIDYLVGRSDDPTIH